MNSIDNLYSKNGQVPSALQYKKRGKQIFVIKYIKYIKCLKISIGSSQTSWLFTQHSLRVELGGTENKFSEQ